MKIYHCGKFPQKLCENAIYGACDESICDGCRLSKNTIKQYFERGGKWHVECDCSMPYRFMNVDVLFLNDQEMEDEVQFSIKAYDKEDLNDLFKNFCLDMGYPKNTVQGVYVVGVADVYEHLS